MTAKKKVRKTNQGYLHFNLLFILLVTVVAYSTSIPNYFVNWDDIIYIMNNDMIKSVSFDNIKKIFSSFFMGNYHPLTILSFYFDYSLFHLNATAYHIHNLILHLLNSLLVYIFCYQLFNKKFVISFIVAFLFAVHPVHVESVAWISERKDLLYTLYYMLALISYLFYYKTKNKKFIIFTFGLFILSLLSKAQAVTLPPVLLLIDYYLVGKFSRKVILEKIPFFIVALIFGIIAIYAQKADNSVNPVGLSPYQSLFYGFYSVWVYLFKFILPVNLTCLYQYPFTAAGKVPLYVYFSPLILIFLAFILYKTWKSHTIIFFGVLFFLMTIFPVLQFLPVGQAVVAERYSYIPYIGLFIIAGSVFSEFRQKLPPVSGRKILIYLGVAVIIIFAILTWKRAAVWKDSIALWTDVMKKNPKSIDAYINRGYIYNQYDQYESGIKDCNDGIALDSNNYKLYINRAISYKMLGKYDLAVADFTKALEKNPQSYGTYLDRGIIYTDDLRQYNRGIADMKKFLKHSPEHVDGNYNLGVSYYKRGTYDSAMIFCQKALELSPKSGCSHYLCALLFGLKNDYLNAYTHAMEAKALGTSVDDALLKEWQQKSNLFIPPVPK